MGIFWGRCYPFAGNPIQRKGGISESRSKNVIGAPDVNCRRFAASISESQSSVLRSLSLCTSALTRTFRRFGILSQVRLHLDAVPVVVLAGVPVVVGAESVV